MMLTNVLQTKWIVRLMVLIYLLLSFNAANATFWCQADEDSHLEVNPVGQCWVDCSPGSEALQPGWKGPQPASSSYTPGDDCLDLPVFTSVLPNSKKAGLLHKNPASLFATHHLPAVPELNLEITGLVNPLLSDYLPEAQTLTVLRTVVLLR